MVGLLVLGVVVLVVVVPGSLVVTRASVETAVRAEAIRAIDL